MATKRKNDEKKEFVKASRRYPRNFAYKNVVGVTIYKAFNKDHKRVEEWTSDLFIVLNHNENGNTFHVDAQDYGPKEARIWITKMIDNPSRIDQTIANLDFDLVEISRKDFDDYHGLTLTRREIFSDSPVDNGFLGEWFAMNVPDLVPCSLSVEEINLLIKYVKDASDASMDAFVAKEVLERGWMLRKERYHLEGWKQ